MSPVSMVPFGAVGIIYLGLRAKRQQKRFSYFLLGLWTGIAVSFDYAYLLRQEAKKRDFDPQKITIYEAWQPENNASLVVEGNGTLVYLKE